MGDNKQNPLFLTFKDINKEIEYKTQYQKESRLFIFTGCLLSIFAWIIYIYSNYLMKTSNLEQITFVICLLGFPLLIFTAVMAFFEKLKNYHQAFCFCIGLSSGFIQLYTGRFAPSSQEFITLSLLLITVFFQFYIFRLSFIYGLFLTIIILGSFQIYILFFVQLEFVNLLALTSTNLVIFSCTILGGYLSEKTRRQYFIQKKITEEQKIEIQREHTRAEKAYELLSKYVPLQLIETISDGQIDSIWKHNRKKLTLFFSDIKDFTKTTDALEPEDMADILNEYLTEMNRIINKYQGTLAQVIGDGLYVFFGAPKNTNDKDHAIRCLKMAIAMQLKMKELNRKWFKFGIDEELQIRCGVNTGMATVGGYGSSDRKEFTAMGMQVNIAARIEAACSPGQIMINHTTWVLVKDDIPCIDKGQIEIKGYHLPIKVYEVDLKQV